MIVLSLPMFLYDRKRALSLFTFGWFLQFVGHYVFEKNKPIVLSARRSPYTIAAALVFVTEEWMDTLKSVGLELHENGNGRRHLLEKRDDIEAV
jgi:uncharacterized membrane protein YGL010W